MPKTGPEARKTPPPVLAAIDELLDQHTTGEIAVILNQRGLTSGTGEPFTRRIVDQTIRGHRIPSRRNRLRRQGLLTPAEAAAAYGVHPGTLKAWRSKGIVSAQRYNDKNEHLYNPPDPASPTIRPKIGRPPRKAA